MRVALFITCFNDTLFPATGRATVELLERLGHEVVFPEEQTCCGQMHGNTGYTDHGSALARRWERVFAGYDVVVSPSASGVGVLREHVPSAGGRLFAFGNGGSATDAQQLAVAVLDVPHVVGGLHERVREQQRTDQGEDPLQEEVPR